MRYHRTCVRPGWAIGRLLARMDTVRRNAYEVVLPSLRFSFLVGLRTVPNCLSHEVM